MFKVATLKLNMFSDLAAYRFGIIYEVPPKTTQTDEVYSITKAEIIDQVEVVEEAFRKLRLRYEVFKIRKIPSLVKSLVSYKPQVVVNLCESVFGNNLLEMSAPVLLELLGISYTGSPPLTLAVCQNKGLTKDILKSRGIPTPKWQVLKSVQEWKGGIRYPLFVKPLHEDASIGIDRKSYVKNRSELEKRVIYTNKRYRQPALVEEYVNGRELNVSILGNDKPKVLPISEILFKSRTQPKIVDYQAKWIKNSKDYEETIPSCPAKLEVSTRRIVEKTALEAYIATGCRDYARIDMRLKGKTPYVIEVNANPDISAESGFVRSLNALRISYTSFIKRILLFAFERKTREILGKASSLYAK